MSTALAALFAALFLGTAVLFLIAHSTNGDLAQQLRDERAAHADRARHEVRWLNERIESRERYADAAFAEQRRLADRLNAVCFAAAALGVSIQDINKALEADA